MYVCKYDGKTTLFSELCNLKWQYSGCSMVCINKCSAPWKSKREKQTTHAVSALLGPALLFGLLSDTPSSGQRADECSTLCAGPHSLSWVPLLSVSTCMCVCGRCGWPVRKLRRPWDVWPLPHVQVWTMSTKVNFGTRDTADVPLFCGCACTFLSSECVNLYTWCENSSINVYQENGTKTKNVTF